MALSNIGAAGQKMRKVYQRRLPEDPSKDYYYIIRETLPMQSLLVEYGFIDNVADQQKLKNNLTDYVEGVVKAIAEYGGYTYTPPGTSIEENTYTVVKGDTLSQIASRFNTTVAELKRLNNLTSDLISIGQVLKIPTTTTQPSETYTVVKGDTLSQIASRFNTTVAELKRLNNLTSDIISVGQILKLPTSTTTPTYGTYTVVKGDSLYKIAQKYNTTVEELKTLNNLTSNTLYIGQQLKVPTNNIEEEEEYEIYTVVKGDSLWLISQKYGVSVDDLIEINDLETVNLQIGDQLKIPKTTPQNTYTVQQGDTLWSIAKDNNVGVEELKLANNLTSNLLSVGQVLIIP